MAGERRIRVVMDGDAKGVTRASEQAKDSLEDWRDGLDDAKRESDRFSDSVENQATDLARLTTQMDKTKDSLSKLASQYARTGDQKFVRQIRAEEKALRDLSKAHKLLSGDDGRRMGVEVGAEIGVGVGRGAWAAVVATFQNIPLQAKVAVVGAGATLAPFLGGALAAGVIGGVGAGGIIGGIAAASQSTAVKSEAAALKEYIGAELFDAAEPFVPGTIRQLNKVRGEFPGFKADLRAIFSEGEGLLDPLVDGALDGVRRLLDSTRRLFESDQGAGPVVRELGRSFSELGDAVADVLDDLSDNGDEAAASLRIVVLGLADIIRFVGGSLNALTQMSKGLVTFGQTALEVMDAVDFADLNPGIKAARERLGEFERGLNEARDAANDATPSVNTYGSATGDAAEKAEAAAEASRRQTDAIQSLKDAYASGIDGALGLAQANLRQAQAVESAKEAVDGKKGATLSERSALLSLIEASNQTVRSMNEQGTSTDKATAKYSSMRKQVVDAGVAMGLSKKEAERYADELLQVPDNVRTTVSTPGLSGAINQVQTYNGWLASIPREVRTRMVTEQRTARGGDKEFRWGGITHAASGLLSQAGMFSGGPTRYAFAEPETGGEAFIPRLGNLQRSLAIWEYVGREWLGALPKRGAGVASVPQSSQPGSGDMITVAVDLDGEPVRTYSARAVRTAIRDQRYRDKVGSV